MARTRVTSLELRDDHLWSGDLRVVCHSADVPVHLREIEEHGHTDVCLVRPAGRPLTRSEPIDQQIAIKVTSGQRARLDALAASRGVTLGVVVRDAIDRHIAPWCDLNGVHLDMSEVAAISQDPDDSCSENSRPR